MIKVKFKTAITTQNVFRSQGCDKKWEKTPFITYKIFRGKIITMRKKSIYIRLTIRSSSGEIIEKNAYNNMR